MKKLITVVSILFLLTLLFSQAAGTTLAQEEESACELDVVVQADDWLSKLADKLYGDPLAYPVIVEATSAQAAVDDSYPVIDNPDVIEPGWKLCVPSTEEAQAMMGASAAMEVAEPTGDLPEIIMWAKAGPEGDALKASAFVYTRETGNPVKVLILGRSGYRQKYNTALAAGSTEVDGILDISRVVPSLAAGGLLEPLDAYIAQAEGYNLEEIPASVMEEMSLDGQIFMAPTDISEESLVYRTDLIPEPPATWEELRQTALEFTQSANPDSPTEYGYAYAGMPGNVVGSWQGIMFSYGARVIDENACVVVDSPEAIESFKLLMDLKNADQATPPDITAWDYPELLVALQEEVIAQASFFTAGMPVLTDCEQSPKVCESIAFVPQPDGPAGSWTRVNPLGIMVNSASPRKEATWEFLAWLTGQEGGRVYTEFGGSSPRTSIINDPELSASRTWYPAVFEAMTQGATSIRHPRAAEIYNVFNQWADQALAGSIAPEEALTQSAAELRDLLDEANNPACSQ